MLESQQCDFYSQFSLETLAKTRNYHKDEEEEEILTKTEIIQRYMNIFAGLREAYVLCDYNSLDSLMVELHEFCYGYDLPEDVDCPEIKDILIHCLNSSVPVEIIASTMHCIANLCKNTNQISNDLLSIEIVKLIRCSYYDSKRKPVLIQPLIHCLSGLSCNGIMFCKDIINVFNKLILKSLPITLSSNLDSSGLIKAAAILLENLSKYLDPQICFQLFIGYAPILRNNGVDLAVLGKIGRKIPEITEVAYKLGLIDDAISFLHSGDVNSICGSLEFLGYVKSGIIEVIFDLMRSNNPDFCVNDNYKISHIACWYASECVKNYPDLCSSDSVQENLLDIIIEIFEEGTLGQRIQCGICLARILKYASIGILANALKSGALNILLDMLSLQEEHILLTAILNRLSWFITSEVASPLISTFIDIFESSDFRYDIEELTNHPNKGVAYGASIFIQHYDALELNSQ